MLAKFILLLTLVVCGADQGKVVLQVGVPGADFYLDGNFVAKTDANGSLPMENFPPGTFRFTVKKDGYLPYDGSFTIAEGESKIIQVQLHQVKAPKLVEAPSPVIKPRTEPKKAPPLSARAIAPPQEKAAEPAPKSQRPPSAGRPTYEKAAPDAAPAAAAPSETQAAEDNSSTAIWAIPGGLAVLLFAGFMVMRQRARRRQMEPPIEMPVIDEPAETAAPMIKQLPEFIEGLKRREELIKAGFIGIKPRDSEHIDKREKEIVIVLPKEAYTSEEEK